MHSRDLANGAVTSKKLGGIALTSSKLADNAVTTSKLADRAVTGSKLAAGSVTESNVVPGSLTGAAFQCAAGDDGLDNRHECFFKLASNGATWAQSVARCRARGATPATLASPAEIEAAAAGGGSPFASGTFWTSQIATGQSPFSNSSAHVVEVKQRSDRRGDPVDRVRVSRCRRVLRR